MTTTDLANYQPRLRPHDLRIDGRYVRLEPLSLVHASALYFANSHDVTGDNWRYLPYGPFATLDDYRAWLARVIDQLDPYFVAIIDRETNQAVGIASFLRIDPINGVIEVGHIHFSPLLQRRIGATEAMFLMMSWAFAQGYRRYEWKCDARNLPSRRAAQRLGLSFEGIFRQAAIVKGQNRDTAWFAAIDGEWPQLRRAFTDYLAPVNFDENGQQKMGLASLTRPILVAFDPALPL